MKLIKAQVLNFRCVEDSTVFTVGSVTCLVGKNESGKTSILNALEKLNPVEESRKGLDKFRDYPRIRLTEYDPNDPVLETEWSLEPDDVAAVEQKLGIGALNASSISVTLRHDGSQEIDVPLKSATVINHIVSEAGCDAAESEKLLKCKDLTEFTKAVQEFEPKSERIATLTTKLSQFRESEPSLGAIDILDDRMPKFLYFSNYDRMNGTVALAELAQKKASNKLTASDRVFFSFLEFAGTSIEDVNAQLRYEPTKAKAEAAGIAISRRIFKYWSQNKHLKVQFEVMPGLAHDPAPYNTGISLKRSEPLKTLWLKKTVRQRCSEQK